VCASFRGDDPAKLAVDRVKSALAREVTEEILGADFVRRFDERGFVEVVARNGHTYSIFQPVPSRSVGDKNVSKLAMSWCVFGVDPRSDEDPQFRHPREHFFAFRSRWMPAYDELVWIWFALKDDPRPFLVSGCDPLEMSGTWQRPVISRMLRKIGRTLGREEYSQAWCRIALRSASTS
jgi:hypothetical protein